MKNKDIYQSVYDALAANDLEQAKSLIQDLKSTVGDTAQLFYLQGKVCMKQSQWSLAMTCFLQSERLEPEGPAKQCRLMLNDIMDFYNKDMYNQ